MLYTVCQGIKEALYGPDSAEIVAEGQEGQADGEHQVPPGRVAIVTFDRAVQFYNLSVSSRHVSIPCFGSFLFCTIA